MDLLTLTTPSLLWQQHAAAYAATRAREASARCDSFFDDSAEIVCGEPLRLPTPADVLILERLKNPFITGGRVADIDPPHVQQFLWALSLANRPGLLAARRFHAFLRRMRPRFTDEAAVARARTEALDFVDLIMQDAPGAGTSRAQAMETALTAEGSRRPLGANFLAIILVPLAAEVGACDPLDGRPWQHTPLPRIFQYLKVARARSDRDFTEDSPHRQIEADFMLALNAARSAGRLVGENGIPGSPHLKEIDPAAVAAAHHA